MKRAIVPNLPWTKSDFTFLREIFHTVGFDFKIWMTIFLFFYVFFLTPLDFNLIKKRSFISNNLLASSAKLMAISADRHNKTYACHVRFVVFDRGCQAWIWMVLIQIRIRLKMEKKILLLIFFLFVKNGTNRKIPNFKTKSSDLCLNLSKLFPSVDKSLYFIWLFTEKLFEFWFFMVPVWRI